MNEGRTYKQVFSDDVAWENGSPVRFETPTGSRSDIIIDFLRVRGCSFEQAELAANDFDDLLEELGQQAESNPSSAASLASVLEGSPVDKLIQGRALLRVLRGVNTRTVEEDAADFGVTRQTLDYHIQKQREHMEYFARKTQVSLKKSSDS